MQQPSDSLALITAWLTAALAVATLSYTWATWISVRALRCPNVTAYFDTDWTWIYLVIQNTGTDVARDTVFSADLTEQELAEIEGPNRHGPRYIVKRDLAFLKAVTQLAPGQSIRHSYLFLALALRDSKPRPFTFRVQYSDRWGKHYEALAPFNIATFGTYDTTHLPEKDSLVVLAERLSDIEKQLRALNRREDLLTREEQDVAAKRQYTEAHRPPFELEEPSNGPVAT